MIKLTSLVFKEETIADQKVQKITDKHGLWVEPDAINCVFEHSFGCNAVIIAGQIFLIEEPVETIMEAKKAGLWNAMKKHLDE